ncbi:branched-chain amino acid ABC transporter substrate-binding protein [Neisseria sp. Ec49-e6-T10]|uniref:branched-chain amino acid ABC transporter substrate-binding protein n=1 Tax=Neisseria sp. Ec49-e6-T10 TaxID=3140744 RepID=UPI003EBF5E40
MSTLRAIGLVAALSLAVAACNKENNDPQGTVANNGSADNGTIVVKIGTANPLTGPFGGWGQDSAYGVQLAVDEANAENIVWEGKKVQFQLLSEDDQADPKTATQVAQRFVDKGVSGVIGHLTSGAAIPASLIYIENNIPVIASSVTSPSFTEGGKKNVYRIIANDSQQGEALAKYAIEKLGIKTFAIIHDKTAYGEGLANDFAKKMQEGGAQKVGEEFTNTSATEFGAIVTAIKVKNPDLIFYGGMDPQAAPLIKELRRQGVPAKFMGADGIKTEKFLELAGEAAIGTFASTTSAPVENMPQFDQFKEKYKATFKQDIVAYAPYAYDAAKTLIDAMKRAKSSDPDVYGPEIAKTKMQGITGEIEFMPSGDIKDPMVTLYEYKDGGWVLVK